MMGRISKFARPWGGQFYLFGAVAEEIEESRRIGYHHTFYHQNPAIARVVDTTVSGLFTADRELFAPLHHMLVGAIITVICWISTAIAAQQQAMIDFEQPEQWHRRALLNICRMGEFSSDRTIRGYARDIWGYHQLKSEHAGRKRDSSTNISHY